MITQDPPSIEGRLETFVPLPMIQFSINKQKYNSRH